MGAELQDIKIAKEITDEMVEPIFGHRKKKDELPMGLPKKTQIKYLIGCMSDDDFRFEVEELMTKSLQCAGSMSKPGDVCVVKEEGSFNNKDGCYQIMVKYLYIPE